jgi:hypothetical protein
MRLSRAAPSALALALMLAAGCSSDATTPLGLQQEAQTNDDSAPVSHLGNTTVYRGRAARVAAEERAAEWARKGDDRFASYLASQSAPIRLPGADDGKRRIGPGSDQPRAIISTDEPSPTTTPNAIIYSSSTVVFVNGSSATVLSSVIYFGNLATTDQTFEVRDLKGTLISPARTVINRGEGEHYPCVGSSWLACSFTFKFVTNSDVSLGVSCDRVVTAWAGHRAEWYLGASKYLGVQIWGSTFSNDARASADNGPCAPPPPPPPPSSPPSGGGDGSTPPSESTPPPLYVPPYYSPKPGQWVCIVHNGGTDYEWRDCWWVENNDTRIATGGAVRSTLGAAFDQPSFTSEDKRPSVFVVISDAVPAGSMAVFERHKQGPYKNVLLVPSANFRPAELVRTMRYVYASLAADGETPAKELSIQLKGTVNDAEVSAVERDYAATFTTMLSKAKSGNVGAYGARPFLEIQLGEAKTK